MCNTEHKYSEFVQCCLYYMCSVRYIMSSILHAVYCVCFANLLCVVCYIMGVLLCRKCIIAQCMFGVSVWCMMNNRLCVTCSI